MLALTTLATKRFLNVLKYRTDENIFRTQIFLHFTLRLHYRGH